MLFLKFTSSNHFCTANRTYRIFQNMYAIFKLSNYRTILLQYHIFISWPKCIWNGLSESFLFIRVPPRSSKCLNYISTKLFRVTNAIRILMTTFIFCPSPRLPVWCYLHFLLFPVNSLCTKVCILFLVLFFLSYK